MRRPHSEKRANGSKRSQAVPNREAAAIPGRAALLAILLCGACATSPPIGVAPLLGEARQNEVAAYGKHQGRDLHVAGVVLQTGMDSYTRIEAEGAVGWGISVEQVLEHSPYMIVGDDRTPTVDLVRCMFTSEDTDVVGKLKTGMKVTFRGRFHQYVHDEGRLVLVLSYCSLD